MSRQRPAVASAADSQAAALPFDCYGGPYLIGPIYDTLKHLHISLFLLTIFGPIYYGPP